MAEQFLRLKTVMERTGLSRSGIYTIILEGSFPKPIKLGPRASAWLASEVDRWIESRISATRSGEMRDQSIRSMRSKSGDRPERHRPKSSKKGRQRDGNRLKSLQVLH